MTEGGESSGESRAIMAKGSDVVDYIHHDLKDSGQFEQEVKEKLKNSNSESESDSDKDSDLENQLEPIQQQQEQQKQRKATSDAGVQRSSSGNLNHKSFNHNNKNNSNNINKNNNNNKNTDNINKNNKNNKNYKNKNRKQQHQQQQQQQTNKKSSPNQTIPQDSPLQQQKQQKPLASDSEEGFLSTSPDSANGGDTRNLDKLTTANKTLIDSKNLKSKSLEKTLGTLFVCTNPQGCLTLHNILDSFKTPISEEQAWALLYQVVSLYRNTTRSFRHHTYQDLEIPETIDNVNVHRDGAVHFSWSDEGQKLKDIQNQRDDDQDDEEHQEHSSNEERGYYNMACLIASHKKVIRQVAVIVYHALDFNLQEDEQCHISQELEDLFNFMTADENEDDCIDEGIDEGFKRWDDEVDFEKFNETKEFDFVLEACKNHIKPTVPDDHYKAVCRALVTEALELRIFLQQVLNSGADNLHLKVADSQTSQQELAKLGFSDWARFWVQVIDEMRRGVRLKAVSYSNAPIEFELTPYEILMEDIRSKKYQLRKVMVNGDIPPRVKKDAHAIIMDFIRSRPPLKKASERQLPPPVQHEPSPREQLMISIRNGQTLKHVQPPTPQRLKDRLLLPATSAPTATSTSLSSISVSVQIASAPTVIPAAMTTSSQSLYESLKIQQQMENITPRSKQRLIKCDLLLLQDDDNLFDDTLATTATTSKPSIGVCSQPKMPPYPIGGYLLSEPPAQTTTITKAQQQQQQPQPQQQQQNRPSTSSSGAGVPESTQVSSGVTARVLRRTKDAYTQDEYHRFFDNALESYDLATQCESRRASLRRHTIVGCQSNFDEAHSTPASRPESRQSDVNSIVGTNDISTTKQLHNTYNQQQQQQQQQQQMHLKRSQSPNSKLSAGGIADNSSYLDNESNGSSNCGHSSSSVGPWNKSFMDEKTWNERGDDRLSLTLEEIVHIRSVMTKAELEALPVGVRVKEDVEKRKVCFLCLRTRFSLFGPWGIQCKLCQRTVCSKCYTKMRIPSEHFRNVPLVLISPSLLASPASSSTPSPSRHVHSSSTGNILDDNFPKTLIERLLSKESEQKARNSVGSAPSSPKHQRSNMSTPGLPSTLAHHHSAVTGHAVEAIHHHHPHHLHHPHDMMTQSYTAGTNNTNNPSISSHSSIMANGSYAKAQAQNKNFSLMSRSMEGPRSLPANSPARPHSNSSTLDRKSKFSRAFTLSSSGTQLSQEQKENLRGEQVPVCNDCKGLVNEITRSGKQKRSSARNRALQNLTLDLSPVWK